MQIKSLHLCFSIALIFNAFSLQAQTKSPQPFIDGIGFTSVQINENTPDWAILMYSENPNLYDIEKRYKQWRIENPNVKNGHTRNFKHLYIYLVQHDGLDKDGFVIPDFERKSHQRKKNWEQQRKVILERTAQSRSTNNTDWVSMGPFIMHRDGAESNIQANIYAIAQSPSNPDVVYAGSEAGATVFKSVDKGTTWSSPNDDISFSGPRELEVDPADSDIVYLGSQHDLNKTTDGGLTWNSVYYNWNAAFNAIIIDPNNPNIMLAGGSERVIRSTNAGSTWTEVFTGKTYDIKFKPGDFSTQYLLVDNASTFQTDFYKSTDSGLNWTKITSGWPNETSTSNKGGRLTVSDGFSNIIYAFIGAEYTAAPTPKDGIKVMKSTDSGSSWTTVLNYDNNGGVNSGQGYYDWDIEVSDNDPDIVYLGTQGRWLTTDGFASTNWAKSGGELGHADLQEALFIGADLWVANDGGIIKFTDETFNNYEVKAYGINAVSYWSFDQGWNRDAQVGSHYHNGTSARQETYANGQFLSYGGAEPQFSAIKHPTPDKAWSKGYGAINGKNLPDNINDPIISFNYNITPNAEYGSATWRESEIEVLPYAYNTHFTGESNTLWRSDDFGLGWEAVASFGNGDSKVTKIEIPRANTDVMYAAEYHPNGYSIYRSNDLGQNFTELTGPAGLSTDGAYIAVDQADEDILWVASRYGGTANEKIYKTTDGGNTWTNLSTDVLDNFSIRAIMPVAGTDGGIYLIASTAVFYRNNTLNDWQVLINNLPASPALRDIKPYYKEGKLRVAGDGRGVWGADLYEDPTIVIPQPTVNLINQPCSRDTLYFDDFSVVNHDGATWSWTITPAPSYVDDLNKRNPKAVFNTPGTYTATMHLNVNGTIYNKTLQKDIVIAEECDPVGLAGRAYDIPEYGKHATINGINKTLNAFTYSLWVRPRASQTATAFFVSKSGSNVGINYYSTTKQVAIHHPGGSTWAIQTGLYAPEDKWTHLALTSDVATGKIMLYVDGEPFEYTNYTAVPIDFDIVKIGWQHNWWGSRWFNGEIDEFCLYDKALTQDEIRLQMNLTKIPTNDPSLIHYYQFNEESGGLTFDKVGINHAETPGDRVVSRGPFGAGSSSKTDVNASGVYNFNDEGLVLDFKSGILPDGEVVVTRIDNQPDYNPGKGALSAAYWVIRNYGPNTTFTGLNSMSFADIGNVANASISSDFRAYKRDSNQDGDTWQALDIGDALNNSNETLTFDNGLNVTSFSQFVISNDAADGWIGAVSNEWNNPANWGKGVIPDANSDVFIPANTPFQPLVNINTAIRSLTIMQNAELRVEPGRTFDVGN